LDKNLQVVEQIILLDMKKEYILTGSDLVQAYDGRVILNHLNFKIAKGEFVTLVGPTGCGKSTLLRLILGSELPFSGEILMEGEHFKSPDKTRGIVYQKYSLFEFIDVKKNVTFGLCLGYYNLFQNIIASNIPFLLRKKKRLKLREFNDEAEKYLEKVGLFEHKDKYPFQLSGGQRQRVAITQSAITNPKILLMDEPLGALDVNTREILQLFIKELWKEMGMTIIFVTHDLEEAVFLGTRLIVLSQYYQGGNGNGAKIVKDIALSWPEPRSAEIKYSPEFNKILHDIKIEGLDKTHLQSIEEFDLSHPDSII
jgi:NitT/TauT family transport system ATP-binding protein